MAVVTVIVCWVIPSFIAGLFVGKLIRLMGTSPNRSGGQR